MRFRVRIVEDRFGSNIVIVMPTAVALVTFEDLERLPEDDERPGKTELLDGEVIQMPPAFLPHNRLAKKLFLRGALRSGLAKWNSKWDIKLAVSPIPGWFPM